MVISIVEELGVCLPFSLPRKRDLRGSSIHVVRQCHCFDFVESVVLGIFLTGLQSYHGRCLWEKSTARSR